MRGGIRAPVVPHTHDVSGAATSFDAKGIALLDDYITSGLLGKTF